MEQVVIYGPPQATVLRLSPPQSLLLVFAQQRERAHARVEDVLDKTIRNKTKKHNTEKKIHTSSSKAGYGWIMDIKSRK